MRYFDIKKDSLEEVISKAINEDNRPSAKELEEAGGKYLKYSDLLLQKGRLMAKNQNTAMIDKEISKEMKKLNIKEKLDPVGKEDGDIDNDGDKDSTDKYLTKKRKAISKAIEKDKKEELEKDDEKSVKKVIKGLKKAVDAHSGQVKTLTKDIQDETNLEEENIKVIMDKDLSNNDFKNLIKKYKLKVKETGDYNQGYAEVEISGDKRDMEKMMKVTRDSLKNYKFNSRTKTYESNNLEAKTTKNVDETLDRIREANVEKGRSMRNILADIWNMGEGKSPFDKEEVEIGEGKPIKPRKKMSVKDVSKDIDGIKRGKELRIDGVLNPSELVKQLKDKYGSKIKAQYGPSNITVTKEELDNSLASQTMRVISQTSIKEKIDPADIDDIATVDDRKAADKNIIIQLRRAQDMKGKADVTFKDNPKKKEKIDIKVINKVLDMFDSLRPNDKAKMQTTIGKSYRDLLKTVQRGR